MLEVRHLTKSFGPKRAVDDVSFTVGEGECCALLGPNGAGKTTLLRLIAGFLCASGGSVRVAGADLFRDPVAARRPIGYLPEGCPLYGELRAAEYLTFRGRIKGLGGRRLRVRVRQALEHAGLEEQAATLVARLSHGQRHRLGLADALLHEPRLLLLDEPFAALDPLQADATAALLAALGRGTSLVLATHRLDLAALVCPRCLVMDRGRLRADESVGAGSPAAALAVRLEVAGDDGSPTPPPFVGALPGVRRTATERLPDGWWVLTCDLEPGPDRRAELAGFVVGHGWRVRALHSAHGPLAAAFHATLGSRTAALAAGNRRQP